MLPRSLIGMVDQVRRQLDPEAEASVVAGFRRRRDSTLVSLRILDGDMVHTLQQEDPDLLRSRSPELVQRLLLTSDELHRALARVAGLVEVDVLGFNCEAHAFDILPLREAHGLTVVPLGMANEQFVVAAWNPTSVDLRRRLVSLTIDVIVHVVAVVVHDEQGVPRKAWLALVEKYPERFMLGSDVVGRFGSLGEQMHGFKPFLDALPEAVAHKVAASSAT